MKEVNTTDTIAENSRPVIVGSMINPDLIPDHIREDIAQEGYEGFMRYCQLRRQNPALERRHQRMLAAYRRRKAEKGEDHDL